MHQSGSGKDPDSSYIPSTSKGHSGLTSPSISSSCNSTGSTESQNKVPIFSDISITKNKTPINDDPEVIELSNNESYMYNNCARNSSNHKSENQFSILASSSILNNNLVSNDNCATKVPNSTNDTIDTSKTKVPIAAFAASSTGSILSTTLLSASVKSSSSLNNSIKSISSISNRHSLINQNNNNIASTSVSSGNNSFNANENNEPMKFQNTHTMMNNSFQDSTPTKSSTDSFDDVVLLNSTKTNSSSINPGKSTMEKDSGGVEKFVGKIVYNKEGSAYIIDDHEKGSSRDKNQDDKRNHDSIPNTDDSLENSSGLRLRPLEESPILKPLLSPLKDQFKDTNNEDLNEERTNENEEDSEKNPSLQGCNPPKISNAFYVTRSAAYYNTLYGQAYAKMLRERMVLPTPDSPIVHSYKVYSMREENNQDKSGSDDTPKNIPLLEVSSVPVKPILMCFLCKLSFGFPSSFLNHCVTEHNIELTNDEKSALERNQNCSAIIQTAGSDKAPLLSFLDPMVKDNHDISVRPNRTLSPNSIKGLLSAALSQQGSDGNNSSFQKGSALNSLLLPPAASSHPGPLPMPKASGPTSLFPTLPSPFGNSQPTSGNMSGVLPSPSDDGSEGDGDKRQTHSQLSIPFHSNQGSSGLDTITEAPPISGTPTSNIFSENSSLQSSMLRNSLDFASSAMNKREGSPPTPTSSNNFTSDGQRSPGLPSLASLSGHTSSQSPMPPGVMTTSMGPLGNPANFPSNANMLQGNTIGACPEHMNGRQAGVDCAKCDIILNSSRMPGGIGWNAARNTCKTLKCPKCNWHYKYQETLEIHMKEKHPDSETNCIYCVTGQQHPRLARGETYTCGYKPYRCEVCNYSTTTKGNLSIHMQSDKHLNNMQELQNGAVVQNPDGSKLPQSPLGPLPRPPGMGPCMSPINLAALQKAKPSWRCDVCNYETNVARNLRIHMTSEKHTHNIMVLQQNVKHIQNLSQGNGNGGMSMPQGNPPSGPPSGLLPPLFGLDPQALLQMQLGLGNVPGLPGPPSSQGNAPEKGGQSEAAMADLAYIQAVMMQMMTGGQFPPGPHPPEFPGVPPLGSGNLPSPGLLGADSGISPETLEPPPEPANENPKYLFNCCVCREFGCDTMESMSQHLTADRTRGREHEVSIVIGGNFICKLCSYKTNLKANFQLHCKTDKHLQRLNHVNHIKEGGPGNEWRLKFLNVTNPVQLRCNACDYYTNSLHKLQLHAANQRHEISTILFSHLKKCEETAIANMEATLSDGSRSPSTMPSRIRPLSYRCCLCKYSGSGKLPLMAHVRSMKHLQMEQIHQLQKRSEGNNDQTEIGDIFQVVEDDDNEEEGNTENDKFADMEVNDNERNHEEPGRGTEKGGKKDKERVEDDLDCVEIKEGSSEETNADRTALNSDGSKTQLDLCASENDGSSNIQKPDNKDEDQDEILEHDNKGPTLSSSKTPTPAAMHCPLCQEPFEEYNVMETHVMLIHSVNSDGLKRLLLLMEGSHWLNNSQSKDRDFSKQKNENEDTDAEVAKDIEGKGDVASNNTTDACLNLANEIDLASKLGGAVSSRHLYKYRCGQCSLAFKTTEKLALHSRYHAMRDATRCRICDRSFRSVSSLLRHIETSHEVDKGGNDTATNKEKIEQYKESLMNHPLLLAGPLTSSNKGTDEDRHESAMDTISGGNGDQQDVVPQEIQITSNDPFKDKTDNMMKRASIPLMPPASLFGMLGNRTKIDKSGINYPMEKYLDPNRPYKCDVCKESFTQKNILLVHYNSVSHLHKLKKTMQDKQMKDSAVKSFGNRGLPQHIQQQNQLIHNNEKSSHPKSGSLETALSNIANANKINLLGNDDEAKPYKCNICNVAYSQGSTLDIHIRSVLHQGRASKLQELAISGQYDPSKPPFEQPESQSFDENQKKLLQGMLSPNSLNSSGSSVPQASPTPLNSNAPPSTPPSISPISSPLMNLKQALLSSKVNQWSPEGVPGIPTSRSQQQLLQLLQTLPLMPGGVRPLDNSSKSPIPFGTDSTFPPRMSGIDEDSSPSSQRPSSVLPMFPGMMIEGGGKKSPQVVKNLLENYGFEMVMQFNEYHQRKKMLDEEERRKKEGNDRDKIEKETNDNKDRNGRSSSNVTVQQLETVDDKNQEQSKEEEEEKDVEKEKKISKQKSASENGDSLPEIRKSKCLLCNKVFSSIWVLKAHREEIHKDIVPQDFLERYVEELKSNITATNSSGAGSDVDEETAKIPINYLTPEKSSEDDNQQNTPPMSQLSASEDPKTSTPKYDSSREHMRLKMTPSPASNNPRVMASPNEKSSHANSSTEEVSSSNEGSTTKSNLTEMQNAFQMAILNAQQQSQGINPMMLQMAQLQGIPPLVAMNLQPPLIPPSLLPSPSGGRASASPRESIAPSPSSIPTFPMDPPMQLLSKLGIDPKMIAQTGLDPQILMQLGQMDPKQILQGGLDPKLLAMMATKQQGAEGKNDELLDQIKPSPPVPGNMDPKSLFNQMMKMGIPPPQVPDPKLLFHLAQMGSSDSNSIKDQIPFPPLPKFDSQKSGSNQALPQTNNHQVADNNPMMSQKPVFQQPPEQVKRARTRITDDQLKVLRSNFDINNSPTEAAINTMAQQTGLPPKVIKHWFRNTLFKERQRNKDSPYNFNNPPSTMLNLEEYEKTGDPQVTIMKPEEGTECGNSSNDGKTEEETPNPSNKEKEVILQPSSSISTPSSTPEIRVRNDEELKERDHDSFAKEMNSVEKAYFQNSMSNRRGPPNLIPLSGDDTPPTSNSLNPVMSSPSSGSGFLPHPLVPNFYPPCSSPGLIPPPGRLPELFNPLANMMSNEQSFREQTPPPMGGSQLGQGKRANRTRFTDYQIKVLQEFFENNAYPKDDDLEYLSKLLGLSPRVIVVWFQNARQKARKIYENQPPLDPHDEGAGRFTRTPGLNYQCKKCLLVFQRYYELIRHQKQHCFKEEDAKRSAQAQKAAAQAAAQFGGPQGCGTSVTAQSEDSNSSTGHDRSISSPMLNPTGPGFGSVLPEGRRSFEAHDDWQHEPNFPLFGRREDSEKKMTPSMFDQLTRVGGCNGPDTDQFPKMQTPGSILFPNYPPTTPFGILQQQALQGASVGLPKAGDSSRDDSADDFDNESIGSSPSSKRKLSDDGGDTDAEKDESGQPRDKRLRTTILPEQLDFLYQKYQIESNPSRKMLEQIANEVGLRKRVVQVWFQNTRARERKGQFRAHQQVINKRCPFCPALFKVRSALESHLATKHADQYTRGEINIDALPDAEGGISGGDVLDSGEERPGNFIPGTTPPLLPISSNIEKSMRKYYEDTMKRYMDDLHGNSRNDGKDGGSPIKGNGMSTPTPPLPLGFPLLPRFPINREGQALDLTSPPPPQHNMTSHLDGSPASKKAITPGLDLSASKSENDGNLGQWDEKSMDGQEGSMSESAQSTGEGYSPGGQVNSDGRSYDFVEGDERMSPMHILEERSGLDSPGSGNFQLSNNHFDSSSLSSSGNKRFRTQMSNIQIKMMKSVFELYKTPTMNECASLGHEIGLQKRVIQVWFQNARAKEKKAKLALQQATGGPDLPGGSNGDLIVNPPLPDECTFCPGHKYVPNKQVLQDHIFTRGHLDNVKIAIEQGRHNPESPGSSLAQAAAAISANHGTNNSLQSSPLLPASSHLSGQYPTNQPSLNQTSSTLLPSSSSSMLPMRLPNTSSNSAHLQMLQMAAAVTQAGGIFPSLPPITTSNITEDGSATNLNSTKMDGTNDEPSSTPTTSTSAPILSNKNNDVRNSSSGQENSNDDGNTQENMGKALMQLYGMGPGMNTFPTGVTQANPFLHPTMFSATGK